MTGRQPVDNTTLSSLDMIKITAKNKIKFGIENFVEHGIHCLPCSDTNDVIDQ